MSEPIVIYDGPDACRQCLGWKRVASGEEAASWKYWAQLPPPSDLAVRLGVVYPVECPRCHGSGKEPTTGGSEEINEAAGNIREIQRLRGLLALAEADAAALRQAITIALPTLDAFGDSRLDMVAEHLEVWRDKPNPGAALLSELTDLRAALSTAQAELDVSQPIVIAAARLDATIRGDGNGRCWCSAHEADALRSALEKARRDG